MDSETPDQSLIDQLALHGVLEQLTKGQAELSFVEQYKSDAIKTIDKNKSIDFLVKELKITDKEQFHKWCQYRRLTDERNLIRYAAYRYKRSLIIKELLKENGETVFLKYKDRLDRVLYSLIRLDSEDLANDLYYSIESSELDFGTAAEEHSCGPEAKTRGIVGPVDLTTPHPEVAARLRTASPGKLFSPFKADDWFAIVRLEYRFDSEYNETTKSFLGGLLVGSKSKELAQKLMNLHLELEVN